MVNSNSFGKLQVQLCELKLEERRVKSDITKLVKNKQMIDFYQGSQHDINHFLKVWSYARNIGQMETLINPNIIA